MKIASNKKDISEQYFGRLKTLFYYGQDKHGHACYLFECLCGNFKVLPLVSVRRQKKAIKSCGCLKKEIEFLKDKRLYKIWRNIKNRCLCKTARDYPYYGGRGIYLDPEWLHFKSFQDWALASGYNNNLELDRCNNDEGYTPKNCRWVTHTINMRNTRRNHLVMYRHEYICISELAERLNISETTIRRRIKEDPLFYKDGE